MSIILEIRIKSECFYVEKLDRKLYKIEKNINDNNEFTLITTKSGIIKLLEIEISKYQYMQYILYLSYKGGLETYITEYSNDHKKNFIVMLEKFIYLQKNISYNYLLH